MLIECNFLADHSSLTTNLIKHDILRGTRNLSFVLRRSLLKTFETVWILVIYIIVQ